MGRGRLENSHGVEMDLGRIGPDRIGLEVVVAAAGGSVPGVAVAVVAALGHGPQPVLVWVELLCSWCRLEMGMKVVDEV